MNKKLQSIPYPEYTTINRDLLTNVINGYKIKNTTTSTYQMWTGSSWINILIDQSLTNGKTWVGDSSNLPSEKDYYQIQYFDATVGTGGDYPILGDLITGITAGKRKFKAIGNIASTGGSDITLTTGQSIFIDLSIYTLDMGSFNFDVQQGASLEVTGNYNNASPYVNRGKIAFAYNSSKGLFGSTGGNDNVKVDNIIIDNNSTANSCYISQKGYFSNIVIELPNYTNGAFYMFKGKVRDAEIIGGGSNCSMIFYDNSTISNFEKNTIENIKFSGIFATNSILVYIYAMSNVIYVSNSYAQFIGTSIDGLIDSTSKVTIRGLFSFISDSTIGNISMNGADYGKINDCIINNTTIVPESGSTAYKLALTGCRFPLLTTITNPAKFYNCIFEKAISCTGNLFVFENCIFLNSLIINGDNGKLTGNKVTGTTTISAGSENNIITGNHFDGGFTDSSGLTNNEINNNI